MSRKERFTPQEKEQACIDYIEGNRSRSEICPRRFTMRIWIIVMQWKT